LVSKTPLSGSKVPSATLGISQVTYTQLGPQGATGRLNDGTYFGDYLHWVTETNSWSSVSNSIILGENAGEYNTGTEFVAIGKEAGKHSSGNYTVAIGKSAGNTGQKSGSIAIGENAGYSNLGTNSIAIGANAGPTGQPNNSIVLNASNNALVGTFANATYISPIQERNDVSVNALCYIPSTKEIVYISKITSTSNSVDISGNIIQNGQIINNYVPSNFSWTANNKVVGYTNNVNSGTFYTGNLTADGITTEIAQITLPIPGIWSIQYNCDVSITVATTYDISYKLLVLSETTSNTTPATPGVSYIDHQKDAISSISQTLRNSLSFSGIYHHTETTGSKTLFLNGEMISGNRTLTISGKYKYTRLA
jgi:hypothetical protein